MNDLLEEKIYIADTANDRVLLVSLPSDSPVAVWDTMKARLLTQDIEGAIPCFASSRANGYRNAFLSIGPSRLVTSMGGIGVIAPVFIEGGTAQYYFEKVIDGETIAFPINFVMENGAWRILEF